MLRSVYVLMLRLHPATFRGRFGREMVEVFDHARGWSAKSGLIADVLLSLIRRWSLRPEFRQPSPTSPAPLFRTIDPYQPCLAAMLEGGFVAIALFAAVIGAASHSGHPLGLSIRIPSVSAGLFADENPRPMFEAFSIKRSIPGDPRRPGMEFLPGGRFRMTNFPLLPVLATAFGVPFQTPESLRIQGIPNWIYTDRYDIEATAGQRTVGMTSKAQIDEIRLMLRSALEDRLKLTVRSVSVEKPVYALTVEPRGPNLEKMKVAEKKCDEAPFDITGCHQFVGGAGRGVRGAAVDMSDPGAIHL